ncbi:hypothetical protein EVAR_11486_1 [Eumeta japonica]|uniref:Uncharacterized protein n=1 Tax=Eumeta variegata TaxID=151549 RepID=A0A4C1TYN3_EUMVA|nr:hypothetical protein EVAR_11486_1 [Eumeta japonica]
MHGHDTKEEELRAFYEDPFEGTRNTSKGGRFNENVKSIDKFSCGGPRERARRAGDAQTADLPADFHRTALIYAPYNNSRAEKFMWRFADRPSRLRPARRRAHTRTHVTANG